MTESHGIVYLMALKIADGARRWSFPHKDPCYRFLLLNRYIKGKISCPTTEITAGKSVIALLL